MDRVGPASIAPETGQLRRGLTLGALVALVVGNQLGTSLYTLPASVANAAGPLGVVSWLVGAVGFWMLAEVFAGLGPRFERTGGPYVFADAAFGRFVGFQTAWCYWLSVWVGNVAIVTGVVAYVGFFVPAVDDVPMVRFVLAQALLWGAAWLNVRGVRESGRVQLVLLVLNVVPFVLLALSLRAFDAANFTPLAPHGMRGMGAGVVLLVWAFSGVESATVAAEEVVGGGEAIRRGTRIGFAIAAVMFILAAVVVTGVLPSDAIGATARPLSLVVERALGPWGGTAIAVLGVVTAFACLNGWTLLLGRIPLSAARDGVFPRAFAAVHPRHGTPARGLLTGTAFASLGLLTYFSQTLLQAFEKLVLLANFGILLMYLLCAAAAVVLCWTPGRVTPERERKWLRAVAVGGFAFVGWVIANIDVGTLAWGSLVVVLGVPMYIFGTRER